MPRNSGCSVDSSRILSSACRSAVWNCVRTFCASVPLASKNLERIEGELLDGNDSESTGLFAGEV
jgi:hypothetical protein